MVAEKRNKRGMGCLLFLILAIGVAMAMFQFGPEMLRKLQLSRKASLLAESIVDQNRYSYHTLVGDSIESIAEKWRNDEGYTEDNQLEAFGKGVYEYTSLLSEKDVIKDTYISDDTNGVLIILNDDVYMVCEPELEGVNTGGDTLNVIGASLFIGKDEEERSSWPDRISPNQYLQIFESEADFDQINSDRLDTMATVPSVRNLLEQVDDDRRVIFWEGHGAMYNASAEFQDAYKDAAFYSISINEEVTENNTEEYDRYLNEHSLIITSKNKYCITEKFFDKYMGYTDNGLFVSGCCYSDNSFFGPVLLKHGFTSLVVNEKSVGGKYARGMMNSIAHYLCETDTYGRMNSIEYAYKQSKEDYEHGLYLVGLRTMNLYMACEPFRLDPKSVVAFKVYHNKNELKNGVYISLKDSEGKEYSVNWHARNGDGQSQEGFWILLPEGTYRYMISADGYETIEKELKVKYCDSIIPVTHYYEGTMIYGIVTDAETNEAIKGVSVSINGKECITDEAGQYSFTINDGGMLRAIIQAPDYIEQILEINLNDEKYSDVFSVPEIQLEKQEIIDSSTDDSFEQSIVADIPEDAGNFYDHYYKVYEEAMKWSEAKEYCEKLGGHLVTITSAKEQEYVESISHGLRLWIGGYRKNDDLKTWYWVNDEIWNYKNWGEHEPNNSNNVISNENRAAIWPSKWNDLNDENTREVSGFICEWEEKNDEEN